MNAPSTAFRPNYRLPNRIQRLTGAATLVVVYGLLLIGAPVILLHLLGGYGVASTVPLALLLVGGAAIALANGWALYRRPTVKYGPMAMVASGAALVYLLVLSLFATGSFQGTVEGRAVAATVGYGDVILLLALIPLLGVLRGLMFWLQDRKYPGRRLVRDYPVR